MTNQVARLISCYLIFSLFAPCIELAIKKLNSKLESVWALQYATLAKA